MSAPILRATTEQGHVWDDPSEDLLFELFQDMANGEELFIIVELLSDPSGTTYVQALRLDDGSFLVEVREGSEESHRHVSGLDLRTAHGVVAAWSFGDPGWRERVSWSPGLPG